MVDKSGQITTFCGIDNIILINTKQIEFSKKFRENDFTEEINFTKFLNKIKINLHHSYG